MPELPDLTVYAENFAKAVVGKRVVRVECRLKKGLDVPPDELSRADFLKVPGPSLKRSPTESPIIKEQILSKVTYYTDEQILYK